MSVAGPSCAPHVYTHLHAHVYTHLHAQVGIGPNKLLAKLASRAAKPDGLRALVAEAEVRALLDQTPLAQLPGGWPVGLRV